MKFEYEIRKIEAWADIEGWSWNTSYHIGNFSTRAENHKCAFLNALHNLGIVCKRGACYVDFDGDIYELRERKSDMPLFAAIPLNF
jgi:hypothetical protein